MPKPAKRPRAAAHTRDHILDAALTLFRERGFDETTMRQIAAAAGMALGAAYYWFPSKEAIVLAYYERVHHEQLTTARAAFARTDDVRARLAAILHGRLEWLRKDRQLLAPIFRRIADPGDPVSVFSAENARVREESIALFAEALAPALPEDTRRLAAVACWTALLGLLLYLAHDRSRGQQRTRALADDVVALIADSLPLYGSPALAPIRDRVTGTLTRAGLLPPS
jgi:AcrR family transcriptional regulator